MKPILWPLLALMTICSFSCSTDAIEYEKTDAFEANYVPETKLEEVEILDLINQHRESLDLSRLESLSAIKSEAYGHTDYMIENDKVSHEYFFQRKANLINKVGAIKVAENVAYAFSSPQSVVNAWLNSEGHRAVIEGDYSNFDISAEQDIEGKWYYTNIFVKR